MIAHRRLMALAEPPAWLPHLQLSYQSSPLAAISRTVNGPTANSPSPRIAVTLPDIRARCVHHRGSGAGFACCRLAETSRAGHCLPVCSREVMPLFLFTSLCNL
ncbi:hypothetical protein EJ06DRAFT_426977 [Trichodelitschia bisporula]|uniref:Uncharacterized protein n=1 Tax=Trichodelitschia bisporula TaxID=703511 RepID=A0A6G1HX79_9PEZI|nr:hypothetical protein EJ06DRAFT_426977 [Trichodelitschia bisporula]